MMNRITIRLRDDETWIGRGAGRKDAGDRVQDNEGHTAVVLAWLLSVSAYSTDFLTHSPTLSLQLSLSWVAFNMRPSSHTTQAWSTVSAGLQQRNGQNGAAS